jgi:hypothetical protein
MALNLICVLITVVNNHNLGHMQHNGYSKVIKFSSTKF